MCAFVLIPAEYAIQRPSLRRKGTEISIIIDGRSRRSDVINFPIDWSIMYLTRYTPDPLVMTLNPAFYGPLPRKGA